MMPAVRRLTLAVLLALAACSKSQPTAPTTTAAAASTQPNIVLTGHITATITGEPLSGLTLDLASHQTTTDASGGFRYEFAPGAITATPLLTIGGPTVLTRQSVVAFATSRDLSTDAIALSPNFDLVFYRQLVRDNFDSPGVLRLIRRWDSAPLVYLRTVDEAGSPIDGTTLDTVEAAIRDTVGAWTGGRFGVADLQRGTDTKEGALGWVTVKWPAQADPSICGRSLVGVSGGWIELDYKNNSCTAPCSKNSRIAPRVVRHELGHTLGFWHTGNPQDLMYGGTWTDSQCNQSPTTREQFHAAIAYARPQGNSDPDNDPTSTSLRFEPSPIVVN
jgi:hypothetical protein